MQTGGHPAESQTSSGFQASPGQLFICMVAVYSDATAGRDRHKPQFWCALYTVGLMRTEGLIENWYQIREIYQVARDFMLQHLKRTG